MNAATNTSIATTGVRTGRMFRFYRIRATVEVEFIPGAGTSIRYANRDVDTLTLEGLPTDLLAYDDTVKVTYSGSGSEARVFVGTVEKIVETHGRGDTVYSRVVCHGPWGAMNRLVFRQSWGVVNQDTGQRTTFSTSHVILNQTVLGEPQTDTAQLREICDYAKSKCGFSAPASNVSGFGICLPADETRDITCASAIQRELRFSPKKIVCFDYSGTGAPAFKIYEPSTSNASYLSAALKGSISKEYTAHPISCVDLYVNDLDTSLLSPTLTHQFYPQNLALLDDVDCLHAYIPLSPGSSSTTWQFLDLSEGQLEELPEFAQDKQFWLQRHPRLRGVSASALTLVGEGERSGEKEYGMISRVSPEQLQAAGLDFEIETFTVQARISQADDTEEDIRLSMTFVMTNASERKYTWQTGSSATSGESLPAGLAEAIYRQRAGHLLNERMVIRLGAVMPVLGDACDGLYLQEYTVDCHGLTADLHFGQPEHLSVEDMRDLLSGFRQRGYASNAPLRSGEEPDEEDMTPVGPIPPIDTSSWSPGFKVKTVVKAAGQGTSKVKLDASTPNGGIIDINAGEVEPGSTIGVHKLTVTDASGGTSEYQILATDDIEVDGGGGDDDGDDGSDCTSVKDIVFASGGTSERDKLILSYNDSRPNKGIEIPDSKVKFTGEADGVETSTTTGDEFELRSANDSNVQFSLSGNVITVGVYYS